MRTSRKHFEYLFAPLIVMAIILYTFNSFDLFPFGKNALNWGDMSQQNLPVLIQFHDILCGTKGPFFSMVNAGGMDYTGIFLFLASSPFSLLAGFISKSNLVFYINIMILMKIMTSSITASIFFSHFFKKLTPLQNIALSVAYALCGYSMMFYQLHTWLDVMYMFPLLLIAMDKLINEYKIAPYTVTLSLMILFQFYLGYMIALFLIFYFLAYIVLSCKNENKKKILVHFGIGTVLALLITAPVLISALFQYRNSARGVNVIGNLVNGAFFTALPTTLGFLFATTMLVVAIPYAVYLRLNKKKEVKVVFWMFVLMVIPVIIEPINKMWHTGSYQAFPVRYGYITVLMGLALIAEIISKLNSLNDTTQRKKKLSTIIVLLFIIAMFGIFIRVFFIANSEVLKSYSTTLWGSDASLWTIIKYTLVALIVLMIFFGQYFIGRIGKRTFSVFLCLFVVTEGVFNCAVYVGNGARETNRYSMAVNLENRIYDNSVYRLKTNNKYFDVNLIGAMGYNSLAHYTSLIDQNYIFAMKKLGYSSYWMEVNSNGSTVLTDAFMGNKYTLYDVFDNNGRKGAVYTDESYYIHKNEFNLSLGNIVSKDKIMAHKKIPDTKRMDFQNTLYNILTDKEENIITSYDYLSTEGVSIEKVGDRIEYKKSNANAGLVNYEINVTGRQNLYFDCFDKLTTNLNEPINCSFNIYVNHRIYEVQYPNKYNNGMLCLGTFENEKVDISVSVLKNGSTDSFGIFGMDLDKLATLNNSVKSADIKIKGDIITADATADNNNQMLLLSIPFNKGFDVYVNDKKVSAEKVLDAFMAIPLEKGKNNVKLEYHTYALRTGLIIGTVGVILLVAVSILLSKFRYKSNKILENTVYYGFMGISRIVFIIIYILPVLLYIICRLLL